jgi:hypothetical protein
LHPDHPQGQTHQWVRRNAPVVPNIWGHPPSDEEEFCRYALILTKPHTGKIEELMGASETWKNAFQTHMKNSSTSVANANVCRNLMHLVKCADDAALHAKMRQEEEEYTAANTHAKKNKKSHTQTETFKMTT